VPQCQWCDCGRLWLGNNTMQFKIELRNELSILEHFDWSNYSVISRKRRHLAGDALLFGWVSGRLSVRRNYKSNTLAPVTNKALGTVPST
jgi:hypothetical protein